MICVLLGADASKGHINASKMSDAQTDKWSRDFQRKKNNIDPLCFHRIFYPRVVPVVPSVFFFFAKNTLSVARGLLSEIVQ